MTKDNIPVPPPPPPPSPMNNKAQRVESHTLKQKEKIVNQSLNNPKTPISFKEMLSNNLSSTQAQNKSKRDFSIDAINKLIAIYYAAAENPDMYNFDAIQGAQNQLKDKVGLINNEIRNIDENSRRHLVGCYIIWSKNYSKDETFQLLEEIKRKYNIPMDNNWIENKYPNQEKLEQEFKNLAEKGEIVLKEKLKTFSENKAGLQKVLMTINLALASIEIKEKITEKREMQDKLSSIRNSLTKEELLEIAAKRGIKTEAPKENNESSSYITQIATLKTKIKGLQAELQLVLGKPEEKSITEEIHNLRQKEAQLVQKMSNSDIDESKIMKIMSTGEHAVSVHATKELEFSLHKEKEKRQEIENSLQHERNNYKELEIQFQNSRKDFKNLSIQLDVSKKEHQKLNDELEHMRLNNQNLEQKVLDFRRLQEEQDRSLAVSAQSNEFNEMEMKQRQNREAAEKELQNICNQFKMRPSIADFAELTSLLINEGSKLSYDDIPGKVYGSTPGFKTKLAEIHENDPKIVTSVLIDLIGEYGKSKNNPNIIKSIKDLSRKFSNSYTNAIDFLCMDNFINKNQNRDNPQIFYQNWTKYFNLLSEIMLPLNSKDFLSYHAALQENCRNSANDKIKLAQQEREKTYDLLPIDLRNNFFTSQVIQRRSNNNSTHIG